MFCSVFVLVELLNALSVLHVGAFIEALRFFLNQETTKFSKYSVLNALNLIPKVSKRLNVTLFLKLLSGFEYVYLWPTEFKTFSKWGGGNCMKNHKTTGKKYANPLVWS